MSAPEKVHPDATREKLLELLRRVYAAWKRHGWEEGETLSEVMPDVSWAVDVSRPDFWDDVERGAEEIRIQEENDALRREKLLTGNWEESE